MYRLPLLICFALLAAFTARAQEFSGGFRAGLNFSSFDGPSEMDATGTELEEFSSSTGFHVGASGNLMFNDYFGLRAELLYSQKGTEYSYQGPSFWIFETQDGGEIIATGNRNEVLSIKNSYIELPVMAVGRFGRVELSGGMSVGVLVSTRGDGELTFSGETEKGTPVEPFTVALDFNFFEGNFQNPALDDGETRELDGETVEIPGSLGAYYQELDDTGKLFNSLDLGLIGGLAVYLNQGLYLGLRANYGLLDITKMERDISRRELDANGDYISRDDDDRNFVLQASIGFSF